MFETFMLCYIAVIATLTFAALMIGFEGKIRRN